ncbi:DUF378 domain-containing protein [candidate division WWE3 bacterium CG10_big_fil_rev_8_21_14_0_10_32_10]|uniref:DUF378 domain-containing protein n=1 Tax=candidate division WWE3 bacterium CG10_big_fil_rev_8_21_14_0_10_32_10 TaxID=1975090 RepID=A0A2H0RBJ5_UNCKA|nr:MAG: DUF378 domain-containing protein [candidate division WWE3 bacterium CG10_big_fil_rev_8_21_14_0_10_32_10]
MMYKVALVLMVVGALNWGLVALFDMDLVAYLLGAMSVLAKTVYLLVAVSGVYVFYVEFTQKK